MTRDAYWARKGQGRCITCEATTEGSHAYCPDCLADRRAHYWTTRIPRTPEEHAMRHLLIVWARQPHPKPTSVPPGPSLACCGTFTQITTLPHVCPECGQVWLVTRS